MPPLIALHDVHRRYELGGETVHALRGVNLDIEAGEFVAVMGPSGSGKSTLMNVLGCLDTPTSGRYVLAGREVSQLGRAERAHVRNKVLGFVFQNFQLLPRTSALENVELPMLYQGIPSRERRARAKAALDQVGLGARLDHTPAQLSGGQQQRVAIARALVTRPQVLLCDEPTGNLDSKTSEEVMGLLTAQHQAGLTVLLVTHEPDVAVFARRRVVVRDGQVVSDTATPHASHTTPDVMPPPAPAQPGPKPGRSP